MNFMCMLFVKETVNYFEIESSLDFFLIIKENVRSFKNSK